MGSVLCFVYDQMADFEVTLALHLLRTRGKREVVSVGYNREPKKGQGGLSCLPEISITDAMKMSDVDALIIPGGPIGDQKPEITDLIRKVYGEGKLVAAICFGPQYLGRAGILDKHRFTTSCSVENIQSLGVADPFPRQNYIDQRVVLDVNVLTAQGRAFVDFALAICDYLNVFSKKEKMESLRKDFTGA